MGGASRLWQRITNLGPLGQGCLFIAILFYSAALWQFLNPASSGSGGSGFFFGGVVRLFGGPGLVVAYAALGILFTWIALATAGKSNR